MQKGQNQHATRCLKQGQNAMPVVN